ncbi:MAG: xanthine dehydrogenase accessory protein XdhC [Devosiaceae bacterium]|nr:xanthine dehydrogenase accessory protein XdhC [Devosiaceae bacterium]
MVVRLEQLDQFVKNKTCILVEIVDAKGSTPRERGAWMLVSITGLLGTIGGGQLEYIAIDTARQMLRGRQEKRELLVPLGPKIGQCCGGKVTVSLKNFNQKLTNEMRVNLVEERAHLRSVFIMGAGHVGQALARALDPLPFKTIVVDTRSDVFEGLPENVEKRLSVLPEAEVRKAPADSVFVVMTHDHALDFMIVKEALGRGDAAYVGMIGSKTKRAAFVRWMKKEGVGKTLCDLLFCPIGGDSCGDKRPEVIGALVAAQILVHTGVRQNGIQEKLNELASF